MTTRNPLVWLVDAEYNVLAKAKEVNASVLPGKSFPDFEIHFHEETTWAAGEILKPGTAKYLVISWWDEPVYVPFNPMMNVAPGETNVKIQPLRLDGVQL